MRKLLLLILFPVLAYSQSGTPRVRVDSIISFTPSSFVRMNDSLQLAKFIEADSTGFPIAPSFGKSRLVFRADSGIYYWDGNSRVRLDSSGMGRITRVLESDGSPSISNVDSLQFNSTNFSLTNPSGARVAVNTVQDINTTAIPNFAGVYINGSGSYLRLWNNSTLRFQTNPNGGEIGIGGTATTANKNVNFAATDGTVAVVGDSPASVTSTGHIQIDTSTTGVATRFDVDSLLNTKVVLESDGSPSVSNVDSLQFNSTNFALTNPSGKRVTVNTIQNIDTTATPKFSGGSIVNSYTLGDASLLISSDYAAGQNSYIEFDHQPTIGQHKVFKFGTGIGLLRTAFTLQDVTNSTDIYYGFLNGGVGIGSTTKNGLLTVGNAGQFFIDTSGNTTTSGNLTLSSFTAGSIPFVGTGGAFRQNNAKFYWDSTNARLGVFGQPADVYGSKLEVFGKIRSAVSAHSWPTTGAGGASWGVRDSWLYGISDSGGIAVAGFARSSDLKNSITETIGSAGFVINDSAGMNAWGLYSDIQHESGANASFGLEVAAKNKGANRTDIPYGGTQGGVIGLWLVGAGDSTYGGSATNPSNTAIKILKNTSGGAAVTRGWNKGIVFQDSALTGSDGVTGTTGIAIEMAKGQNLNWRSAAGQGAAIRSDVVTSGKDVGMIFGDDSISFQLTGGTQFAKFTPAATQPTAGRNFLTLTGSTLNGGIEFTTKQADASAIGVGIIQASDVNSTAADKRVAAITYNLGGATANNRGGDMLFYTKNDGVSGLNEAMRIYRNGNVGIGDNAPSQMFSIGSGGKFTISSNGIIAKYNNIAVVSNGVPSIYARADSTAQSAAIGTTTLYAVPASGAGQYRVQWNAKVTTAATSSSTLGALTIVYTDPDNVVQTITCGAQTNAGAIATTSTGNSTTTVLLGVPMLLNCKASTNITYAFAYTSSGATAMQYNFHINLEKL